MSPVRVSPGRAVSAPSPRALGSASLNAYLAGAPGSWDRCPTEEYSTRRIPELAAIISSIQNSLRREGAIRVPPGYAPSATPAP